MPYIELSDCFVDDKGHNGSGVFSCPEFVDLTGFHKYCSKSDIDRKNQKTSDKDNCYQAIYSMLEFYSELYSVASDAYHSSYCPSTKSESREIPISIDGFYDVFIRKSEATEPPISLIVEISDDYNTIKRVGDNLNKILRRERQRVGLDHVQQIDTQCMRWLSRQPGLTSAQKAGPRQQIMAVVRQENYDTLENRVFRRFLQMCVSSASVYRREYHDRFPDSRRIRSVERLMNLCLSILEKPELEKVSPIRSSVQPNFVLQNNPSYRKIWEYYQRLLEREKIMDCLWVNRHSLFREFISHAFVAIMDEKQSSSVVNSFTNYFWLRKYPTKDGHFFDEESESYHGYFPSVTGKAYGCRFLDEKSRMVYRSSSRGDVGSIVFAYVPDLEDSIEPIRTQKCNEINILALSEFPFDNGSCYAFDLSSNESKKVLPFMLFDIVKEILS
ncbi:MAG: DUF2357 domain-containing protein [Candidatus Ornithospirochaeta sp.]|nr:DUF2357 domain-containing protein [Candidatus Ornithospirochaeta sp.]